MIYLSQMLGTPVIDSNGDTIGTVNDMGIATGEVFPRVTSLAFQGPEKTPFMISWRKYVDSFDESGVYLKVPSTDIRFSYLQPDEVLIARDLLNKQIVDTRGMKVVRVNDLKLSDTGSALRLLGAEVGARGILRSLSPALERAALSISKTFGREIPEQVIAWNYMDLLDRDLSDVKLSVTHKTLDELHPADIADIIEQLDPRLRSQVFAQLDDTQAAEAMAELENDEVAAEIVEDMGEAEASRMLSEMDPDDAADLVGELGHEKAEKLLRLMGVKERRAIDQLLGYRDGTAGRIMTSEFVALDRDATIADAIEHIRGLEEDFESVRYVYTLDADGRLEGVVSIHRLLVEDRGTKLADVATEATIVSAPDDDQEDVAKTINKYNLLAMPVVDEMRHILGIVTVDDALDVLEEEHEEDLQIAGGAATTLSSDEPRGLMSRFLSSELWFFFWMAGILACVFFAGITSANVLAAVIISAALPICLHVGDTMFRYVANFYIEFDEADEDAPSLLGFAIRGIGVAFVFAMAVILIAFGVAGIIEQSQIGADSKFAALFVSSARTGLEVAAIVCVCLFAVAPGLLALLRKREHEDKETNGLALRACVLAGTAAVFVAASMLLLAGGLR